MIRSFQRWPVLSRGPIVLLPRLLRGSLLLLVVGTATALAATPAESIKTILAVKPLGEGNAAALVAVKELSQADVSQLPTILAAFDDASPLAANWLRGAFEAIADRALKAGQLPAAPLEQFVRNVNHHAGARRLAYDWLLKVEPAAAERLIPGMLQDPGAEFRRDAVSRLLTQAQDLLEKGQKEAAVAVYRQALQGAVDDDQVKEIVKPLKEAGQTIDLQKHFGFLPRWRLIGPFDNTDKKGFDVSYPPETERNFDAKYPGKTGEVGWIEFNTTDDYGVVDLTKALAAHKGAVTYAATEFISPNEQRVEIRLGTPNAWKLWINGALVFGRDEYHRGTQLDQYRVPVSLKAGTNTLLLKVCQNEQTEEWAQKWQYQLRVCTSGGAGILSAPQAAAAIRAPTR